MTTFSTRTRHVVLGASLVLTSPLAQACEGDLIPEASSEAGLIAESPDCGVLASCCRSLPDDVTASCGRLASAAIDSECASELATLQASGYCSSPGDGGARLDAAAQRDAGMPADATIRSDAHPAVASAACVLLGACCQSPSLPAAETATCQAFLASGDEPECATLLNSLTEANECTPVGNAESCPELAACCSVASFPAEFQAPCAGAVNAGIQADCADQLSQYQMTQLCVADGGSTAPACSMLQTCCISALFPGSSQSTCFSIARDDSAGQCASAYAGYVGVGYCD